MFEKNMIFLALILMLLIFTGCTEQPDGNSDNNQDNNQGSINDIPEIEDEIVLPIEMRGTPEWSEVNDYIQWFIGATGKEIAQMDSITYYLKLDGQEHLRSTGLNCYFEFERNNNIWDSRCTSIYVEPHRLLFGIYGLQYENKEYSVDQIKDYLGDEITWGVVSGQDFFQYSFDDIRVRFFADKENGVLLHGSFVLIVNALEDKVELFSGFEETTALSDSILGRAEWNVIRERRAELGKAMDEIDALDYFQLNPYTYYYIDTKTGREYGFGSNGMCSAIVFPAKELFPDAAANLTIKELMDRLKVDLVWSNYDGGFYSFAFNDFMFYLDTDEKQNVLLDSDVEMKSSWW